MVLQRWQSVYLLIAAIALGLATFMPVFDIVRLDKSVLPVDLPSLESAAMPGGYAYFILLALSALISLITIFKYKNLKLQKSLCSINMLLIIAAYITIAVCANFTAGIEIARWQLASLLPAFALICPGIRINLHISRKKQNNPRLQADSRCRPSEVNRRTKLKKRLIF